jgi:hypothetical protein
VLFEMKNYKILVKVYTVSSLIILLSVLLNCLLFEWPLGTIALALFTSIVLASPALISLQIVIWLCQRINFENTFMWMLLLSIIPLLSLLTAWMFSDFVPGKIWFVLLLGMLSSYIALVKHAVIVSQLFKDI